MIGVLSTSSPFASVAVWSAAGELVYDQQRLADRLASAAIAQILNEVFEQWPAATFAGWVADVGPGSFTGTRVGVTMAKTLAWAQGEPAAGVSAFDLVAVSEPAIIPARRGQYWLREPGAEPVLIDGDSDYTPNPPRAAHCILASLTWIDPVQLVPAYGFEPRISTPKTRSGGAPSPP